MTSARVPRFLAALGIVSALSVTAACTSADPTPDGAASSDASPSSSTTVEAGPVDSAASTLTEVLPVQAVGEAPATDGVADGVLAPTNRWYSGLAYADLPARAFATPVTVQVDTGSIALALPTVTASDALIAASTGALLTVTVEGSTARPQVTVNDPVYTALSYYGPNGTLATATVSEGWPAIGLVADADVTFTLSTAPTWADGVGTVEIEGTTYAVKTSGAQTDGATVTMSAGGWLMAFPIPADVTAADYIDAMGSPLASVETAYSGATTTLTYATVDGDSTVAVPSATVEASGLTDGAELACEAGTFATIDGSTVACAADALTWTVDEVTPQLTLDVSSLTGDEQEAVLSALADDVDAEAYPSDTYFGSKALYRDAQLLALADDLGDEDSAAEIRTRLAAALTQWTDADGCATAQTRCFVYDPNWSGVVGYEVSFGSELFNDHHFHWGYLIYAAAVAVQEGAVDIDDVAPVIDALVADIASTGTDQVPTTRSFDPWAGHSWASGTSEFADGNNQESSSEAVLAWTAVAAWATLRGDEAAAERATWMLSAEAHSAIAYYVRPDTTFASEYTHQVVGIEWGGKRDWATWFSADPAAMLGIQLIPLAPTQIGILTPTDDAEDTQVLSSITEAMPTGTADQFTDLITMYSALTDDEAQAAAWDIALTLPDDSLDDVMTRAYMLAFIASAQ